MRGIRRSTSAKATGVAGVGGTVANRPPRAAARRVTWSSVAAASSHPHPCHDRVRGGEAFDGPRADGSAVGTVTPPTYPRGPDRVGVRPEGGTAAGRAYPA